MESYIQIHKIVLVIVFFEIQTDGKKVMLKKRVERAINNALAVELIRLHRSSHQNVHPSVPNLVWVNTYAKQIHPDTVHFGNRVV